eukprot:5764894-Amphidinium_carterae.1
MPGSQQRRSTIGFSVQPHLSSPVRFVLESTGDDTETFELAWAGGQMTQCVSMSGQATVTVTSATATRDGPVTIRINVEGLF